MPHASFRLASLPLAILALALALSACGDDVTDPDAFLDSAEAEAVARSAAELPSLGEFIRHGASASLSDRLALDRAHQLWNAGTADHDSRGLARRRLASAYAAPILAGTVPPEHWDDAQERMLAWIGTADRMLRRLPMPTVEERLRAARHHLARADAAPTAESRVSHLIQATSELVETTPRHVARTLAADAATAVERAGTRPGRPANDPSLDRARRLAEWAAHAVDEEDYMRAIQRAYYAIQLAEGQ